MPNFDVPMIGQANSKICWLACYQMLYGYRKFSTAVPYEKANAAGLSTTSGLFSDDWGKARVAMGLTSYRVGYLKQSYENLTDILDKHGPMWCAGDFLPDFSGHAIVISGYDSTKLRINDPLEIYKYQSYDYRTFDWWRKRVKELPFACRVWP